MSLYSRSSLLLSTLALVSAGLAPTMALGASSVMPVIAQADQSGGSGGCGVNRSNNTIDVDGVAKTLETAIQEATQSLMGCQGKKSSVLIRLTAVGPHRLPNEINAHGQITITSAVPNDGYPKIEQDGRQQVTVRSPLEMSHIEWVGNYRGFNVLSDFTLVDSFVKYGDNGDPESTDRHLIVSERLGGAPQPQGDSRTITINHTEFKNIGIGSFKDIDSVEINRSVVVLEGQRFSALSILNSGSIDTENQLVDNAFKATNHKIDSYVVVSARRATITNNEFSINFDSSTDNTARKASLHFFSHDQLADGFQAIEVSKNSFNDGPGIEWTENAGAPASSANAVRVERNDFSGGVGAFLNELNPNQQQALTAACNYWGKIDLKKIKAPGLDQVLFGEELDTAVCGSPDDMPPPPSGHGPGAPGPGGPSQPVPPYVPPAPVPPAPAPLPKPTPSDDPVFPKEIKEDTKQEVAIDKTGLRLAGLTRFETAVEAAQHRYPKEAENGRPNQTVIVARGDVAADSVAAVPLAKALDAPILLTPSKEAHPTMVDEIRRLVKGSGEVILMGGETAISSEVERTIAGLGVPVSRIQGANRADTAVQTAKKLEAMDKLKSVYLVDGQDWQPALITGPVAAKTTGVTLLTNGDALAPETKAFLDAHPKVGVTAIGKNAAATGVSKKAVEGRDGTELSLKVAREFFDATDRIGVATSADFADALIGGGHIGQEGGALVLTNGRNASRVNAYLKTQPTITKLYVYGGAERIGVASEQAR